MQGWTQTADTDKSFHSPNIILSFGAFRYGQSLQLTCVEFILLSRLPSLLLFN